MSSLNSILFGPFLLVVFLTYHFVTTSPRARVWVLFTASIVFYLAASPNFLPFFAGLTALAYWAGKRTCETHSRVVRAASLAVGVVVPVAVLILFKARWNLQFGWAVPVGLSYFTFQLMGYLFDCADGEIAPIGFRELLGSLLFFPTISAGPIVAVRAVHPQIEAGPTPNWLALKRGLLLFSNGLFKKMIGDILTELPAPPLIAHSISPVAAWANLLQISARFYADFSGYTDMALGVGLLFGIQLPENFRLPFLAHSVADHWRRWHITLSDWFRRYVFMPLAAAYGRHPKVGPKLFWFLSQLNIMLVMLLIGLWHGFSLNFLIWGLINGVLICVSPWFDRVRAWGPKGHFLAVLTTFYLTTVARVYTFAPSPGAAAQFLLPAHSWSAAASVKPVDVLGLIIAVLGLVIPHALDWLILEQKEWLDGTWSVWILIAMLWVSVLVLGGPAQPFIYMRI